MVVKEGCEHTLSDALINFDLEIGYILVGGGIA